MQEAFGAETRDAVARAILAGAPVAMLDEEAATVRAFGGLELTKRQYAVLRAVASNEGLNQAELARATGINRSTLADLVARMTDKGLLKRARSRVDSRSSALSLAPKIRELFKSAAGLLPDVQDFSPVKIEAKFRESGRPAARAIARSAERSKRRAEG